jgi:hypothetical protein
VVGGRGRGRGGGGVTSASRKGRVRSRVLLCWCGAGAAACGGRGRLRASVGGGSDGRELTEAPWGLHSVCVHGTRGSDVRREGGTTGRASGLGAGTGPAPPPRGSRQADCFLSFPARRERGEVWSDLLFGSRPCGHGATRVVARARSGGDQRTRHLFLLGWGRRSGMHDARRMTEGARWVELRLVVLMESIIR